YNCRRSYRISLFHYTTLFRSLKDGVISDYNITERMLKYFLEKALGKMLFKPRVIICVPSGVTQVEQRAVIDASNQAGAIKTYIIDRKSKSLNSSHVSNSYSVV